VAKTYAGRIVEQTKNGEAAFIPHIVDNYND